MQYLDLLKKNKNIAYEIIPNINNELENVLLTVEKELKMTYNTFEEAIKSDEMNQLKKMFEIIIFTRRSVLPTKFFLSDMFS